MTKESIKLAAVHGRPAWINNGTADPFGQFFQLLQRACNIRPGLPLVLNAARARIAEDSAVQGASNSFDEQSLACSRALPALKGGLGHLSGLLLLESSSLPNPMHGSSRWGLCALVTGCADTQGCVEGDTMMRFAMVSGPKSVVCGFKASRSVGGLQSSLVADSDC